MKNEKIVTVALVIIIVAALSTFLFITYGGDVFKGKPSLEMGDCVDVNYIGKYSSNNTVFDSSYSDVENKTNGTALNIFLSLDATEYPPEGYEYYSSGMIEGFIEGLVGLKEGEEATIGPIPPEKAYGVYPKEGDVITIEDPQTGDEVKIVFVEITENVAMPEEYASILGNGTTTLYLIRVDTYELNEKLTLYPTWENSTTVTKINETTMWTYTTPSEDKLTNFTWIDEMTGMEYGDSSSSVTSINETTIVITHSPAIGTKMEGYGWYGSIEYTVLNLTDAKINASYLAEDGVNISYAEFDRVRNITRNQTQEITAEYPSEILEQTLAIIKLYYDPDLTLSTNRLAGESLTFEVKIEKVYKTSEEES
ncbi:MAG: FKBP-type peptidyl-prolyl cis-trans isomerase [Thermoplasmatales archaeon]|nr:MAG: FKBP-type peptidyl-prolyl cis-trans isomerase [Thermoplasmatales archaeon]